MTRRADLPAARPSAWSSLTAMPRSPEVVERAGDGVDLHDLRQRAAVRWPRPSVVFPSISHRSAAEADGLLDLGQRAELADELGAEPTAAERRRADHEVRGHAGTDLLVERRAQRRGEQREQRHDGDADHQRGGRRRARGAGSAVRSARRASRRRRAPGAGPPRWPGPRAGAAPAPTNSAPTTSASPPSPAGEERAGRGAVPAPRSRPPTRTPAPTSSAAPVEPGRLRARTLQRRERRDRRRAPGRQLRGDERGDRPRRRSRSPGRRR